MGEDTQGKGIRYSQDADDQNAIWDIKENYSQMEKVITTQLSFTVPHGGTSGHNREQIWREMFANLLPRKFCIEQSVFIIDSNGKVSKEVDLAIFDETYTPYIFRAGKMKFIPIEAVAAAIECKSHSIDSPSIENWIDSIQSLHTSNRSYARMAALIACGEEQSVKTQSATRPLCILCFMEGDEKPSQKARTKLDVVIEAKKEGRLKITWNADRKSLYDWYHSLNHAKEERTQTEQKDGKKEAPGEGKGAAERTWVELVEDRKLEDYIVKQGESELSLLAFNFQLNQILMLINNPMLFPHIAYAEMFNQNGRRKETKKEKEEKEKKEKEKEGKEKEGKGG